MENPNVSKKYMVYIKEAEKISDLIRMLNATTSLFYYEDISVAEISQCLGQKENTVKSLLRRARMMLKEKLEGGYDFV